MSLSPALSDDQNQNNSSHTDDDQSSVASSQDSSPQAKRFCSREERLPFIDLSGAAAMRYAMQQHQQHINEYAPAFYPQLNQMPVPMYMPSSATAYNINHRFHLNFPAHLNSLECDYSTGNEDDINKTEEHLPELYVDVVNTLPEETQVSPSSNVCDATPSPVHTPPPHKKSKSDTMLSCDLPVKRSSFSISSILGGNTRNIVSV